MSEYNLPPQPKKRCTIYVDAFNWDFGIFQHRPSWKWLNPQSFFAQIKITVYIPVLEDERQRRRNDNYHRMGATCKPLPLTDIPRHIFPGTVRINENETITRPAEWT